MSLLLQDVSIRVGDKQLLSEVTLQCEPGSVLGIIGENGAGKSTLLNAMAGLSSPSSGHVSINGNTLHDESPASLAKVRAVLPQSSELSFPLAAVEVVRLALSLSSYPLHQQDGLLKHCLDRFDVLDLAERNYLTLSGGEKQRVQLARVTAQLLCHKHTDTQFLLLDEPISALDLYQQYQTLDSIRELADSGIGIVTILHDLNLASLYCDRIAILKNGRLIANGQPDQVLTETTIQSAFKLDVRVEPHPDTHTPFLTPRVAICRDPNNHNKQSLLS